MGSKPDFGELGRAVRGRRLPGADPDDHGSGLGSREPAAVYQYWRRVTREARMPAQITLGGARQRDR